MLIPLQLATPRLLLRPLEERDRIPFRALNADPIVMRFYAAPLTPAESDEAFARYQSNQAREGFSLFAAELKETGAFVGIIGMQTMSFAIPDLPQPAVEIGWRLTQAAQGRGLATEGARRIVDHAFNTLRLAGVVAVTVPVNSPSRNVMHKLGMEHRPDLTFDHPKVPAGHAFRPHVLYTLTNPARSTGS